MDDLSKAEARYLEPPELPPMCERCYELATCEVFENACAPTLLCAECAGPKCDGCGAPEPSACECEY